MAEHAANDISYYLLVEDRHRDHLAGIRHWSNLKAGFSGTFIWIKDLDYAQAHAPEVKSLPYKTLFYAKDGKLYLLNSRLPDRAVPSLLWTPIERALPVQLPPFNHNYFGMHGAISMQLVPADTETEAIAMITTADVLQVYLRTAPAVRLQQLNWVILDNDMVLLAGRPLLPVDGQVFWQRGDFLVPTGYDFDLFLLYDTMNLLLNPAQDHWVVWHTDHTYFLVNKNDMQPLSRSAFRSEMLLPG